MVDGERVIHSVSPDVAPQKSQTYRRAYEEIDYARRDSHPGSA